MKEQLGEIEKLTATGGHQEALRRLEQLAVKYPGDPRIWASRAFVLSHEGARASAVVDWSRAIELCSHEPHYLYMRGIDLFACGRFQEAISDFTNVLKLCDRYKSDYYRAPAHFFRADAHVRLREFDEAVIDCAHVPDDMRTWTDRLRSKADILSDCRSRGGPKI
jgi:tetratricopeptide (TPR) repeat protein